MKLNDLSSELIYPGQKIKLLLTKTQIEAEKNLHMKNLLEIDRDEYVESIIAEGNNQGLMSFDEMSILESYNDVESGMKGFLFENIR